MRISTNYSPIFLFAETNILVMEFSKKKCYKATGDAKQNNSLK